MKNCVKNLTLLLVVFLLTSPLCSSSFAQGTTGTTAFTYQGQLSDNGTNANGVYTMIFKLYDAITNGNQIRSTITTAPTLANGLFTVTLDFGSNVFNGFNRWLDITVQSGSDSEELSPRVQVLPTPYAIFATSAAQVASVAQTYSGTNLVSEDAWQVGVRLGDPAHILVFSDNNVPQMYIETNGAGTFFPFDVYATNFEGGTFFGNGSGLTNVPTTSYEANLVIVRGTLDSSGDIVLGQGFTVTLTSSTTRTITFNTPFSDNPTVALGQHGSSGNSIVDLVTSTADSFSTIANGAAGFEFIAIGPR
jgi:hypothetical protein